MQHIPVGNKHDDPYVFSFNDNGDIVGLHHLMAVAINIFGHLPHTLDAVYLNFCDY